MTNAADQSPETRPHAHVVGSVHFIEHTIAADQPALKMGSPDAYIEKNRPAVSANCGCPEYPNQIATTVGWRLQSLQWFQLLQTFSVQPALKGVCNPWTCGGAGLAKQNQLLYPIHVEGASTRIRLTLMCSPLFQPWGCSVKFGLVYYIRLIFS